MNILITGGAGFIGSNLFAYLIKKPIIDQITIYDNLSECSIAYIEHIAGIHFNDSHEVKKATINTNGKSIILQHTFAFYAKNRLFLV